MEAWNGTLDNHSCLHWGQHDAADANKHQVVKTRLPDLASPRGVLFSFAWFENPTTGGRKLIWYIDGVPLMRASKPAGTPPLKEFRIMSKIAVGGTVNEGTLPADGTYEMVVRDWRRGMRLWVDGWRLKGIGCVQGRASLLRLHNVEARAYKSIGVAVVRAHSNDIGRPARDQTSIALC